MNDTVFLPSMQKHLCKQKVTIVSKGFCSKFLKSCQIISYMEASIPTLTKSKKHLDGSMLFFQKVLSYNVVYASQPLFQKRKKGSFFCPGQDVCFWLWHPHTTPVAQKLVSSYSRLSEELSCLFMHIM